MRHVHEVSKIKWECSCVCMFIILPGPFTACIRMCHNEGVLDVGTCTCDCASGFSGANCESECIAKHVN